MERLRFLRWRTLGTLLPRGTAILLGAFAVLILLSVPLFVLFANMMADRARLRTAVVAAQLMGAQPGTLEALAALRSAAVEGGTVEEALAAANQGGVAWAAVLERVVPQPTAGVRLVGLSQQGSQLEIRALASDEPSLVAYEAQLRGSPLFEPLALQRGLAQPGALSFSVTLRLRGYVQ